MLARSILSIAALAALCLSPAPTQEKGDPDKATVEIHLAKEHVPDGIKAGAQANLVTVRSSAKTKKGTFIFATAPLAEAVEVVKISPVEKQDDPSKAFVAVLRVSKAQAAKIEKMKATMVTVAQTGPAGETVTVQRPVTLRLEATKQ
jgi:hypothetical protein